MSDRDFVKFMRDLEERYKKKSGLTDRAHYKIFYGPVRPAPILLLGINPGGDPANTEPDGTKHKTGEVAASSAGFYENGEHDVLDCDWKENKGLKKLLVPLLNGDEEAIRLKVVKTNLAFRRSPKSTDIDIDAAKAEAASFLSEIMVAVSPRLIILTSLDLMAFVNSFCVNVSGATEQTKDENVKQVVFESASARIQGCESASLIVRVAHASQFSWTYAKYRVVERINSALQAQLGAPAEFSLRKHSAELGRYVLSRGLKRVPMNKADYEGIYYIKRAPIRMKGHNDESWKKIENVMAKSGGKADFDALAIAVKDHRHGTQSARYPYQFVTYCIRSGWLQRFR